MRDFLNKFKLAIGFGGNRPPWESAYIYFVIIFLGYFTADLAVLKIQGSLLPLLVTRPQASHQTYTPLARAPNYGKIIQRNLFNSDGLIPPAFSERAGQPSSEDGPPVPTELPIKLVGTIVHANPSRSVASVDVKGGKVMSYRKDDEIEEFGAKITKIERNKVIFLNQQANRLEFVEIKDAFAISFGAHKPIGGGSSFGSEAGSGDEIHRVSDNNFTVRRSLLKRQLEDLPQLLQQARAVPNIDPSTGAINGFRIMDILSGSYFEQIGIRRNDVIKSVNGTIVDSQAKAMELLNAFREANNVTLGIERNGRDEEISYSMKE